MADFDPYHKWLGIPKSEQPANHYRLLGVALFETDPDVIESAADQRMIYVQQMATGPHAALSQQILNELAAARVCLLKPDKKAAYDDQLRRVTKPQNDSSTRNVYGLADAPVTQDEEDGNEAEFSAGDAVPPSGEVDVVVLLETAEWCLNSNEFDVAIKTLRRIPTRDRDAAYERLYQRAMESLEARKSARPSERPQPPKSLPNFRDTRAPGNASGTTPALWHGHSKTSKSKNFGMLVLSVLLGIVAATLLLYWGVAKTLSRNSGLPALGQVTGVVTLDGKPLVAAEVRFEPMQEGVTTNNRISGSYSRTDSNGRYTLRYTRDYTGAAVGKHIVRISKTDDAGVEVVPAMFNAKSVLSKEVASGANEIGFPLVSNSVAVATAVPINSPASTADSQPQQTGTVSPTRMAAAPTSNPATTAEVVPPLAVAPFNEATAKQHQDAWAQHLGRQVLETNSIWMQLVLLPPGRFKMGSPNSDSDASSSEKLQVEVTLTQPLFVGQTEVTQGQWISVMGTEPWKGQTYVREGSDYAATYVSWEDAQEFCRKLRDKEGNTYRLLTEAEWEYACRAGTTTKYHFGDSEGSLVTYAWFDKNASAIGEKYSHEVGKKQSNPFGLYDMHGNVWEWCQDWFGGDKLSGGENPTGAASGSFRVSRGGSWRFSAGHCRSAFRCGYSPGLRSYSLGFRVAQVVSEVSSPATGSVPQRTSTASPTLTVAAPTSNPAPTAKTAPELAVAPFDAVQARQHQQTWADHLGVQLVEQNRIGMELVLIPPGEFLMGSPNSNSDAKPDEIPQHLVRLTQPLLVGRTEVTQRQWADIMRTRPWRGQQGSREAANNPATYVSWYDALEFCRILGEREGKTYRLLTEAEWEFACRAGTTTRYSFGDDASPMSVYAWNRNLRFPFDVGKKKPNPFGLLDMHGNSAEWCQDWYNKDYYADSAASVAVDPAGPESAQQVRIVRGGFWSGSDQECRSAYRDGRQANRGNATTGFRVARIP